MGRGGRAGNPSQTSPPFWSRPGAALSLERITPAFGSHTGKSRRRWPKWRGRTGRFPPRGEPAKSVAPLPLYHEGGFGEVVFGATLCITSSSAAGKQADPRLVAPEQLIGKASTINSAWVFSLLSLYIIFYKRGANQSLREQGGADSNPLVCNLDKALFFIRFSSRKSDGAVRQIVGKLLFCYGSRTVVDLC